ncbi:MAG TPA: amidohydrolase [Peptococcaceae bacterium]|nr:amidohydrolase [Peptococcaceae bacterium]
MAKDKVLEMLNYRTNSFEILNYQIDSKEEKVIIPEGIVNVEKGQIMKKAIVVKDGLVKAVIGKDEAAKYKKTQIVNMAGLTIFPGFIDSHVHLALDGYDFNNSIRRWEKPLLMRNYLLNTLDKIVCCGVIAIRDGGDKNCLALRAKELSLKKGPLIRATGAALRKDGYYGTFLGDGIKDMLEIEERIINLKKSGADHVKVILSGIVSFKEYGKVGKVQFSFSELNTIVKISRQLGLKIMAHASSDEAALLAAEAGVDSIEHGYFIGDRTLELMAQKSIFWVPTVVPVYNQTVEPWKKSFLPSQLDLIEKTYLLHLEKIKKAVTLGVKVVIGTDAGATAVPHGDSYYFEMQLLKKAGLSNLQILQAATINGAKLLGLEEMLGSIEEGKLAFFVAVRGNPLEDLDTLKNITTISCL